MKAIILGATGMVGIEVLDQCLAAEPIDQVVTLGRSATSIDHPKLNEIEHRNFLDFSNREEDLAQADICFYCLGVYQTKVPKEQFWHITVDYQAALVTTLERVNKGIVFCLFSTQGADPSERSPFLFSKVKGRAEKHLRASALETKYIFRPGFINPGRKSAIPGPGLWLCKPLYKLFPPLGIDAAELARAMVAVGLKGHEKNLLGNSALRAIARAERRQ